MPSDFSTIQPSYIESDNIGRYVRHNAEQLADSNVHERFAAHVALMRLGIDKVYTSGRSSYTVIRVDGDADFPLDRALKFDYSELITLAGRLFRSEITAPRPDDPSVVKTVMFNDMQIWAENSDYWDECQTAITDIGGDNESVRRLFLFDRELWFESDWSKLSPKKRSDTLHDAAGCLLGIIGHEQLEWPWGAIALSDVWQTAEAPFLFRDSELILDDTTGNPPIIPPSYYASALLGKDTVLYIYSYEENNELRLPRLYWLKFYKRKHSHAAGGFQHAFVELWNRSTKDVDSIKSLWRSSPNCMQIHEYLIERNFAMPPEYQFLKALESDGITEIESSSSPIAFVSYNRGNRKLINKLCAALMSHGVQTWTWEEKFRSGDDVFHTPISVIRTKADAFLFCMSQQSMAKPRSGMWSELNAAIEVDKDRNPSGQRFIIPIKLNKCELPSMVINGVDLNRMTYRELYGPKSKWNAGVRRIAKEIRASAKLRRQK